jgi:hypothetical protein
MTSSRFFVTNLGVPQSMTLLNLLFSSFALESFSILLKPKLPATIGATGAPFYEGIYGSGAKSDFFKASISLCLYVITG